MHASCKALSSFLLTVLWLTGCASSSSRHSVQIAGGQTVELERQGSGFKQAENARVIIADAGLQAVNLNGINYVRWKFAISPKQATSLSLVRIEEVSGPAPLLLINDVAPQTDGGRWSESGGLMDLSSASVRWLFEPGDTVRVFRLTINEPDGQSYLLYQAVPYTPASKEAIRTMVRE
jgi:hypothetical protein